MKKEVKSVLTGIAGIVAGVVVSLLALNLLVEMTIQSAKDLGGVEAQVVTLKSSTDALAEQLINERIDMKKLQEDLAAVKNSSVAEIGNTMEALDSLSSEEGDLILALQIQLNGLTLGLGECRSVSGQCGFPVASHSNAYLDRVATSCPADAPILRAVRFGRCGQSNEGMQFLTTCCALTIAN